MPSGITLTIGAGQIIKSGGASLTVDGTLTAQGTAAAPSSSRRSTTTRRAATPTTTASSSPKPADWTGLQFNADSAGQRPGLRRPVLRRRIRRAGDQRQRRAAVLSNSVVSDSAGTGLRFSRAPPRSSPTRFRATRATPSRRMSPPIWSSPARRPPLDRQRQQRRGRGSRESGREPDLEQPGHRLHARRQRRRAQRHHAHHRRRADHQVGRGLADGRWHPDGAGDRGGARRLHIDQRRFAGGDTNNNGRAVRPSRPTGPACNSTPTAWQRPELRRPVLRRRIRRPGIYDNGGQLGLSNGVVSDCAGTGLRFTQAPPHSSPTRFRATRATPSRRMSTPIWHHRRDGHRA